ncbi:MAG: DUF1501 domain-containing protein [Acidobacteriota bacterium]
MADHHPRCFTVWLAGGGVKPGVSLGETDDFSYNIVRDPVHAHDLNATILHLLGLAGPQTLDLSFLKRRDFPADRRTRRTCPHRCWRNHKLVTTTSQPACIHCSQPERIFS